MPARERIRKADVSKSVMNKKTEKTDSEKSENRAFKKSENCIIKMTEKIRKQNINKLIKNKFFTERTEAADKEKLIIFSENISFFSTSLFSESKNSKEMKKVAII